MYQLSSQGMNFHRIQYWGLLKFVKKIQVWLKSGKNIGHFTLRPEYVLLLLVT